MAWPANGEAVIHTLANGIAGARPVKAVALLSSGATLPFIQKADGLHIQVPAEAPGKYAYVYRIEFAATEK